MLISDKRGLEILRALSMIVKSHVPMADAPPVDNQYDPFSSQVSAISASTTSIGGTCPSGGFGGGGRGSGPPPPPLPCNPILNKILQNMGQLELQLTKLASASSQSSMPEYYMKSPLDITILNTILPTVTESLKFNRFNGIGGVGSVYKGVLDNGTLVAIKALNLEDEAAHKSFNIECQVLGLVFEFMSNGSLERHLHCDSRKCNIGGVYKIDLQTRLHIAMYVARGLAYLHHDFSIQVVHCDLKPNNILLDFYMTTHIADFGNAHILFENSMDSFSALATLKGALRYIAPEYGVGARISAEGDIYTYGIMLLEMLTRKRPTNQMFVV
ncbi:putative receptor-like protein kinase At3g47110 [Cryptomeria japonica]|uniref:putative receptor-like protein kinase At3g47110 n=1 Tax=Cryptomeria japonica TaxID=3369 RepID=UPI0027DA46C8|nr:putative receptor-like protein kinase At3g47110 [Cryptomeria japonica]